jgi:hypothetical protein
MSYHGNLKRKGAIHFYFKEFCMENVELIVVIRYYLREVHKKKAKYESMPVNSLHFQSPKSHGVTDTS